MMFPDASALSRMRTVMNMSTVFVGMTPLNAIVSIIREDKYTGVTRMMILSNVKPLEYLLGITLYIMAISTVIAVVFGIMGGFVGISLLWFVMSVLLGTFTSLVFGSMLTVQTKHGGAASAAVSLISLVNATIHKVAASNPMFMKIARFWYTTQISDLIGDVYDRYYLNIPERLLIIGANLAVFLILFTVLFKKNRIIEK
jgi:ABC-2 type transport system permease protein